MTTQTHFSSRAVLRLIEAGTWATCAGCGEPVKFSAKRRLEQVIANVYVDGVWNRVEHYHAECYDRAGQPYGNPGPGRPILSGERRPERPNTADSAA